MFKIDIKDLCWVNGKIDEPDDLCAHGKVVAVIGNETFEFDGTVSSTAIYLLKTLTENHFIGEENQMIPCCGHFIIANETLDNVQISGCDNGVDWSVIHNDDGSIKLVTENGNETTVSFDEYEKTVFNFVDKIEQFYRSCTPKKIPKDNFDKNGYIAFWIEWYRRRYHDKTIANHIKPDFYKNYPKDIRQHMRAAEFEEKHPKAHKTFTLLGILMLCLPMYIYILLECIVLNSPNSPLLLLGFAGAFCIGAGAFGIIAAWMKQYPGHIFTAICFAVGAVLVTLSHFLLFN